MRVMRSLLPTIPFDWMLKGALYADEGRGRMVERAVNVVDVIPAY